MSTHNIFLWRNKKNIFLLSGTMCNKENPFGLAKTGLNSGVVLFLGDLIAEFYYVYFLF